MLVGSRVEGWHFGERLRGWWRFAGHMYHLHYEEGSNQDGLDSAHPDGIACTDQSLALCKKIEQG
jgi:hypothetical protein